MENNNGKGIFYGVIGIATLIVAIVGATFAYFTATVEREGVINVTSYSGFSVSLAINTVVGVDKLIPLDSDKYLASALSNEVEIGEGENKVKTKAPCKDINGDQVCAIYEMVLTNNGATSLDFVGYLSAEANNYETNNLKYRVYNCADGDDADTLADEFIEITGSPKVDAPAFGATVTDLPKFVLGTDNSTTLSIEGKVEGQDAPTKKVCLVMWLEEAKDAEGNPKPQNEDQGKTFTGKVTFNATNANGEGLQASFSS